MISTINSNNSPLKEDTSSKVVIDNFEFNKMCFEATKRVIKNKD